MRRHSLSNHNLQSYPLPPPPGPGVAPFFRRFSAAARTPLPPLQDCAKLPRYLKKVVSFEITNSRSVFHEKRKTKCGLSIATCERGIEMGGGAAFSKGYHFMKNFRSYFGGALFFFGSYTYVASFFFNPEKEKVRAEKLY